MARLNFLRDGRAKSVLAGALFCLLDTACDRRAAELPAAGPGEGIQSAAGASGAGGVGSSSSGAPGGGEGGQSGQSGAGAGGEGGACLGNCFPPAPADGAPAASGTPTTFVVSRIFLGESDWDGNASDSAWQLYGFDLDGRGVLTPDDQHCAPSPTAPADVFASWPGGIDNSFGRNLAWKFGSFASTLPASVSLTAAVRAGSSSLAISFASFGPLPDFSAADVSAVAVRGPSNADGVVQPVGDWPSYVWHPLPDPPARFPAGYVTGGEWASAVVPKGVAPAASSSTDLSLTLFFGAYPLTLVVHHAIVVAKVSADGTSLQEGSLGGVLSLAEIDAALHQYWFYFAPACGGPTDLGIMASFADAADARMDGSSDSKLPCDAISIGLGFEAQASNLGPTNAPLPPPRTCAGEAVPLTCDAAHGPAGCCAVVFGTGGPATDLAVLYSCEDGATVKQVTCGASCGWEAAIGAYSCQGTAAQPTGEHPYGCGP